ncbi:NADH-quinone oxidoreductase subunit NuoG [Thiohalorhabdus methylotrophus]|uniref:NADH-quinone oxidoreductase n=1 Tax=Thiohalorhabdus methylotrophus TaxID=3242694 RepID=A0ABV4TWG3_9GAMM
MASIIVDGRTYPADPQTNLLHACLSQGLDLPYFCWHPAMGSVGACRQCAVKQFADESDESGRIVMACMTPAADGTRIAIEDPEARDFRASVIEWLMINHPHDCPTCEEGGECHLQDMTQMTGHTYRRYRFDKRTFRNQDLGPFINHEMNRCITCYRCVRFYRDYAGGSDLDAFGAHDHVYFGRQADGTLESEFSGNLAEVCPTGVFTDRTLSEHYVRKWDLRTAPSVCVHCGLGCNTSPGERYDRLRRIQNRYHEAVNGYFLCDRGRFGYQFVNSPRRILEPTRHHRPRAAESHADTEEALELLDEAAARPHRTIGIGSPRASLEVNFALRRLVGPENFSPGIGAAEGRLLNETVDILHRTPAHIAGMAETEECDAVLVLGDDIPDTAPRLALSLRQATRHRALAQAEKLGIPLWQDAAVRQASPHAYSPLVLATPGATRLDDCADPALRLAPADIARFGFAVAYALDAEAPPVTDLEPGLEEAARETADRLRHAERPLVVSGYGAGSTAVLQAASNVARSLYRSERPARIHLTVPECDSLGAALLGGRPLEDGLRALREGEADTLLVAENDLYTRADFETVRTALETAERVVVLDHLHHHTAEAADALLPAATFAEGDGTLVNNEGRAQRFFQVHSPTAEVQEGWRWLREAGRRAGRDEEFEWTSLDAVTEACAGEIPALATIPEAAPRAGYRLANRRLAHQPFRYSGRTAMRAHRSVHEPTPIADGDSPFSDSMEGHYGNQPGALLPFVWTPGWNSVHALNKFQEEVGGALQGGPAGVRLLDGGAAPGGGYFPDVPEAFAPRAGQWLVVPVHHVFGSEELSAEGQAVAERMPAPYLAVHPEDATGAGFEPSGEAWVLLEVDGKSFSLPLRPETGLARGLAGLPVGLPGMAPADLPAWGALREAGR